MSTQYIHSGQVDCALDNPHGNYRSCVKWTTTHREGRAVEIEHNYGQSRIFPDKNARALCFFSWEMKETAEGL